MRKGAERGASVRLTLTPFPANALANVGSEDSADLCERAIQTGRKAVHAGGGCKRYQSQNQELFNQALAGFILVKAIQEFQDRGFHCCYYFLWFPAL